MKNLRCIFGFHDTYIEMDNLAHLKCHRCDRNYTGVS